MRTAVASPARGNDDRDDPDVAPRRQLVDRPLDPSLQDALAVPGDEAVRSIEPVRATGPGSAPDPQVMRTVLACPRGRLVEQPPPDATTAMGQLDADAHHLGPHLGDQAGVHGDVDESGHVGTDLGDEDDVALRQGAEAPR